MPAAQQNHGTLERVAGGEWYVTLSERRWEADRSLRAASVRSAIESQFPSVQTHDVVHLGSGWEFDVYLTSDGWCFRFPRRAELSSIFERESRVHALVARVLHPFAAVPIVELWGQPGPEFPYAFAGHRMVPGIGADDPLAPVSPSMAPDLASLLRSLHDVPEREASAAGVVHDKEGSEEWLAEAMSSAAELTGISPVVDKAVQWLRGVQDIPSPYTGPAKLVHNDLGPQHLLVGADSGKLVGVIDWTDAALGDPVLDFLFLPMWRGWKFVATILESYPPVDPEFGTRLSFQVRVRSLHWLHASIEEGTDLQKHLKWVANAFAENDSL